MVEQLKTNRQNSDELIPTKLNTVSNAKLREYKQFTKKRPKSAKLAPLDESKLLSQNSCGMMFM